MLPGVDSQPVRVAGVAIPFTRRRGLAIFLGGNDLKMTPCGDDLNPTTAQPVFVEWEDIQNHEDWNDESETNSTCSLKSIGFLIEDDDRKIVIAMTYDYENERWANKFAIGKLPPVVVKLNVTEATPLLAVRHVPRPQEDRMAPNPNKMERDQFHQTLAIPGQP